MAFRSELDAMRERAEGAELETRRLEGVLDEQAKRMERVAEIESQLEAARAKIRSTTGSPGAWARGSIAPMVLGAVVGGGMMYLLGVSRLAAAREASELDATRRAAEHRALETELESTRSDRDAARAERDDMTLATRRDLDDLRVVLVALSGAAGMADRLDPASPPPSDGRAVRPLAFGRVSHVEGAAPVAQGTPCEVRAFERSDECVGQIVCDGNVLHSFGCAVAPATRLRGHGASVSVDSEVLGWRVIVGAAARPVSTTAPPGPALPFPTAPRGLTPP